jgi:hypothetical protein
MTADTRGADEAASTSTRERPPIGDIALADLFARAGWPLCLLKARTAALYLDSVLWESVTDPVLHERLKAVRGLCRAHVHQVLSMDRAQSGASLGAAIPFTAVIRECLTELTLVAESGGRASRRMMAKARLAPDGPVCAQIALAESGALVQIVGLAAEPAWRSAFHQAALWARDLIRLWAVALDRGSTWVVVDRRRTGGADPDLYRAARGLCDSFQPRSRAPNDRS